MADGSKDQVSEEGARVAALLAWSACVLILLMIASFAALSAPNGEPFGLLSIVLVPETVAALVGGLVASSRPRNPVGWIVLGHAFLLTQHASSGLVSQPQSQSRVRGVLRWPQRTLHRPRGGGRRARKALAGGE